MSTVWHDFTNKRLSTVGMGMAALLVILSLLLGVVLWVGTEGYFFLYPAIDTHFTPRYSETAFRAIEVGMTKAEVIARLGLSFKRESDQGWLYSADGACGWWDFAWLVRAVNFDEQGRVSNLSAIIAYD